MVPCVENVRKGVSDLTTPQHEGENNGVTGEREERRRDAGRDARGNCPLAARADSGAVRLTECRRRK